MKYKKYPKYKDSGVDWIGDIPEGWKVEPLKFHVRINERKLNDNTEDELKISYIDVGSVHAGGKIDDPEIIKFIDAPSRARRIIKKNDTILSTVRTYLNAIAFVDGKNDGKICSTGFAVISPKKNIQSKFLYYLLSSQHYVDHVMANSAGVTYPAINPSDLGIFPILVLPFDNAQEISYFLDEQTKQFDELIAKFKAQITLLEEKKQATINQAVTKGLDPSVPMKDSGVDWIGDIPEGWEKRKLNGISNITRLAGYEYTEYWETDEGGEIIALRGQNIGFKKIILKNIDRISNKLSKKLIRSRLFKNDIVFPCVGTIGNAVVIEENDKFHINQNMAKISPYAEIHPYFLMYYLLSNLTKFQINYFNSSGVQPSVLVGDLRRFQIIIPSYSEQKQITKFLDTQTTQFDELIAKSKTQIILLEEKRQALITAAVTGKIDVKSEVVA